MTTNLPEERTSTDVAVREQHTDIAVIPAPTRPAHRFADYWYVFSLVGGALAGSAALVDSQQAKLWLSTGSLACWVAAVAMTLTKGQNR